MTLAAAKASVVACWPLNEASGNALDSVGSNNLTDNNTVAAGTGKLYANARDLEFGNSEFFSIADNATLSVSDIDFMVRLWVNVESKTALRDIIVKWGTASNNEYILIYNSSNDRFEWYVSSSGANQVGVTASNFGSPSIATWYLIHCWHDAANNLIGISVNAGTANTTSHTLGVFNGTSNFKLGDRDGSGFFYDGMLQDALLMKNRFLDATERTEDYAAGTGVAFANWSGTSIALLAPPNLSGNFVEMCGNFAN